MTESVSRKRPLHATNSTVLPKIRRIISSHPRQITKCDILKDSKPNTATSPQQTLMDTVKSFGVEVAIESSLNVKEFFHEFSQSEIDAYDQVVLQAIRSRDMDQLRIFHNSGRPLNCSNRFGESLLHLACRRGFVDVATFLILDAGVTVQVKDDYGRTPLHDACWACEPNFELIQLILTQSPDLLFMSDRRGHCPLSYSRQEHWTAWNEFLSSANEDLILPRHDATTVQQLKH